MPCPSSIRCRDSNSQPLVHESPHITTRPGLPPDWATFYSTIWTHCTCVMKCLCNKIFPTTPLSSRSKISHWIMLLHLCKSSRFYSRLFWLWTYLLTFFTFLLLNFIHSLFISLCECLLVSPQNSYQGRFTVQILHGFYISLFIKYFFKNGQTPASFFVYFWSFQANNTNFLTNQCKKCPFSIQVRDSNPRPFKHNH